MKLSNKFLVLIAVFVLLSGMLCVSAADIDGLNTTDVSHSFDLAKSENKNVILIFDQKGCVYCDLLKENTLSDSEVQKLLNEKFITSIVDIDKEYGLADKYQIFGTPIIVVANATGDEISRIEGYVEADEFLNALKEI